MAAGWLNGYAGMTEPAPELALAAICRELVRLGRRFASVGGLAVSVRAEVRFTRDVGIAVAVADDLEAESVTYELRSAGTPRLPAWNTRRFTAFRPFV